MERGNLPGCQMYVSDIENHWPTWYLEIVNRLTHLRRKKKKNAWKGLENCELGEGIIAFVSPGSKMIRMMTSLFSLLTWRKWLLYNPGYNLRFHILRFRGVIWFWEILPISLTAWRHIALYKMALYSYLTYTHTWGIRMVSLESFLCLPSPFSSWKNIRCAPPHQTSLSLCIPPFCAFT